MTVEVLSTLLAELERRGIRLALRGEDLALRAPKGALTAELKAAIVQHKAMLRDSLQQRAAAEGVLHERIAERTARAPDAVALRWGVESWTYAELEQQAGAVAAELVARGLPAEAPVACAGPPSARLWVAALGVMKAGGVVDAQAPDWRLVAGAGDGQLVVGLDDLDRARPAAGAPRVAREQLAWRRGAAAVTHRALAARLDALAAATGWSAADVAGVDGTAAAADGWRWAWLAWWVGGGVAVDADAAPTVVVRADGPTVRIARGAVTWRVLELAAAGPVAIADGEADAEVLGGPLPGVRLQVLDRDRRPVGVDVPGTLYVAGDGLARGEPASADRTAAAFVPDPQGQRGARMWRTDLAVRWRAGGVLERIAPAVDDAVRRVAAPASVALEDELEALWLQTNLSQNQFLVWTGQKLLEDVPLYNVAALFLIDGALDPARFRRAVQDVVDRADALRTVFDEIHGLPRQRVLPALRYEVEVLDFSGHDDPDAALRAWAAARVRERLDPGERLFDLVLCQLSPSRSVVYYCQHHLTGDGYAMVRFCDHVGRFYLDPPAPGAQPLPPFADFVAAERSKRGGTAYRRSQDYWSAKLAEPCEPLPFYGDPGAPRGTRVDRVASRWGIARSAGVRALAEGRFAAASSGVSLFSVLAGAYFAFLHRISGHRRLAVGTPLHNRTSKPFKDTLGLFMKVAPLRVDIAADETFATLIEKVRDELTQTMRHQRCATGNSPQRKVYDVLFNLETVPLAEIAGLPVEIEAVYRGHELDALSLLVRDYARTGEFVLEFDFHCDLFDEVERAQTQAQFAAVTDALLADPDAPLDTVSLLDPPTAVALRRWGRGPAAVPAAAPWLDAFARAVAAHPEAVAVRSGARTLTYRELDQRAAALARQLRALGVGPDVPVGLSLPRTPALLVGVVGILRASGAYVPIDPAYPAARRAAMLARSGARALVVDDATVEAAVPVVVPVADAPADAPRLPPAAVEAAHLAYVIFTSGSTGEPQAVQVSHGAIAHYAAAAAAEFALTPADRVLQFASISFDTAAEEILPALARGAAVVLRDEPMLGSAAAFFAQCETWEITVLDLPTAYWHELVRDVAAGRAAAPAALRLVILGGEAARADAVEAWRAAVGDRVRLLNTYGPTEATIVATWADLTAAPAPEPDGGPAGARRRPVPIGRPIPGAEAHVLDDALQPVPIGILGELYLGGPGLARGYRDAPARTAQRYVPHPDSDAPGARLYRTGDLCRWNRAGDLEFVGRADLQVKVRGYRVELGEIEAALRRHPALADAVVVATGDPSGTQSLVAYVVPHDACPPVDALRRHLTGSLPAHMVPAAFLQLAALPRTPNGKLDRRALQQHDDLAGQLARSYVAPRTAREEQVAAIFCDVLGVARAGATDSFFALGGHSLSALRLVSALEQRTGVALPMAVVLEEPTVERLAALLDGGAGDLPANLIAMRPTGARPPLFFVHPSGGLVLDYVELLRHLEPEQPFYGLQATGLADGEEPLPSIEAMAARYVAAIRAVQPAGPYRIGGYSLGAVVAFEMAQQLRAAGDEVALLALVEMDAPRGPGDPAAADLDDPKWVLGIAEELNRLPGVKIRLRDRDLRGQPSAAQMAQLDAQLAASGGLRSWARKRLPPGAAELLGAGLPLLRRVLRVTHAGMLALREYTPRPYPGRVAVLRATASATGTFGVARDAAGDPRLGWGAVVEPACAVYEVPGDHFTVVSAQHAKGLAEALAAALRAAD